MAFLPHLGCQAAKDLFCCCLLLQALKKHSSICRAFSNAAGHVPGGTPGQLPAGLTPGAPQPTALPRASLNGGVLKAAPILKMVTAAPERGLRTRTRHGQLHSFTPHQRVPLFLAGSHSFCHHSPLSSHFSVKH